MALKNIFLPLILGVYCFLNLSFAEIPPSVWEVLRNDFSLEAETKHPEVQKQLNWLMRHPSYVNELIQSKPYMYHIITEIKKKHLPGELALLPMIESTYDPFAYSNKGAAGLWQIMPETSNDLGIKRDWWADGRRGIHPSTDAALRYLRYLHHFFHGNWLLAIAAYNAGEGAIAKAVKRGHFSVEKPSTFWALDIPSETKAYVPRLLALAEIIRHPEKYHIHLPRIAHQPYFTAIDLNSPLDLNHAAKLAGISYQELIQLNPGFNHWSTSPHQPTKLLIPMEKALYFSRNLASLSQDKRADFIQHHVKKGETLNSIAKHYFTTKTLLKELNQLSRNKLTPGQSILIPSPKQTDSKPKPVDIAKPNGYKRIHIVQENESYRDIAHKYHASKEKIISWNHLSSDHRLHPGETLILL